MQKTGNILLTGFMGTGKSVVGRQLAARLGMDFIDTDVLIEQQAGMSIPEIFSQLGESYFRELEKGVIRSLAGCHDNVIATGGGALIDPENLQIMKSIGLVICLTAHPETIYERVRHQTHRPLLHVPDPINRIRHLLKERNRFYAQADHQVPTDKKNMNEITDKILEIVNTTA